MTGVTRGQQGKPVDPPPRAEDDGPSLAETTKFIQRKLSELNKVNYLIYVHNNQNGIDYSESRVDELTSVQANAIVCTISYHWKTTNNGKINDDQNYHFELKDVIAIDVLSGEQDQKETDTQQGHPEYSYRLDPPIFVLKVRRPNNILNAFAFYREDDANRTAKALNHAVELCGGGNKDPF